MSKVRSILRLLDQGKSKREIARRCRVSRNSIDKYASIFDDHPLGLKELLKLTDKELYSVIAPPAGHETTHEELYTLFPQYENELKRIGVNKLSLWEEYKNDYPLGVQYSQFCEHFNRYLKAQQLSYMALCTLLLQTKHEEAPIFCPFNRLFDAFTRSYTGMVNKTLHHRIIGALACTIIVGGSIFIFRAVPGGFVPAEDQGYLISALMLPDGASLQRTRVTGESFQQKLKQDESVDKVFVIAGNDIIGGGLKPNAGTVFIPLKDWSERSTGADELAKKFTGLGMTLPDGLALVFNPPAIRGLGAAGGFEAYIQARGDADPQKLAGVIQQFTEALKKRPELTGINTFFRPTSPQLYVEVDEAKAISLDIPVADVYQTLRSTMGSLYVNDFNLNGCTYRVQLQADGAYRAKPDDLGKVYVRLSMLSVQRSADMLLGVPHNWIQSWAFLLWLCAQTGYAPGDLTWVFGDAHIYCEPSHLEVVNQMCYWLDSIVFGPLTPVRLIYNGKPGDEFKAADFEMIGKIPEPTIITRPALVFRSMQ